MLLCQGKRHAVSQALAPCQQWDCDVTADKVPGAGFCESLDTAVQRCRCLRGPLFKSLSGVMI